ncbi:Map microtubule affinity-regulating kinase [Nowakowskiella sp. JEL0078]|nr:Map microtubule affinity-regulating kinase [Nowakowskiella sp. JEL0078]
MLVDDPWINESYDNSPILVDVSQKVEEEENIIRLMETRFHIDRESLLKGLRENVYDDTTSIYYLLYHEKDTRSQIEAEVAMLPKVVVADAPMTKVKEKEAKEKQLPAMGAIDEDVVMQGEAVESVAPLARPALKAKPKKRRFTVGGEADVAKYADEDQEAAELLKKVQNQSSNKDDSAKPSSGTLIPNRTEANGSTAAPQSGNMIPQPPTSPAPNIPVSVATISNRNSVTDPPQINGEDSSLNGQRKRNNTIVGILRSHIRRQSEFSNVTSPPSPSTDKNDDSLGSQTTSSFGDSQTGMGRNSTTMTPGSSDDNKPRSLRFTFNSNTTSTKPPDEIVQEVTNVCAKNNVNFKVTTRFLIECFWNNPVAGKDGVKFEIEVCKLPRLKNLHGLRFKRVGGSSTDYKDICEKILAEIALV